MEAGALAGAEAGEDGVQVFDDEDAWDVLEEIPNDSAAALLLIEHHWAVPRRDAIARAGGFRISDGFISPLDLIELGLVTAEETRHAAPVHPLGVMRSKDSGDAVIDIDEAAEDLDHLIRAEECLRSSWRGSRWSTQRARPRARRAVRRRRKEQICGGEFGGALA